MILPLLFAAMGARADSSAPALKVVVADFELTQTAPEDERSRQEEDHHRIEMITHQVRGAFAHAPGYRLLDRGVRDERPPNSYLSCKSCIYEWGRARGADVVVVGWVQKVSNLILNINVAVLDAQRERALKLGSVSIRGDNDRMWRLGVDYILDNQILAGGGG